LIGQQGSRFVLELPTTDTDQRVWEQCTISGKWWCKMNNSGREFMEDPLEGFPRLASKLHSLWLARTYPFASIGKDVWVHYSCELSRSIAGHIRVGNGVVLARDVWFNIPNVPNRTEPAIIIEDGCGLGRCSVISAKNRIHVERNTIFGPSVLVTDHNHGFEDLTVPIARQGMEQGGKIRIEEGCWIGFRAAIICNHGELVIGRGSVVGANSVVSRSVPAYSVAVGNPARIVKQYDPARKIWALGSMRSGDANLAKYLVRLGGDFADPN
jgi:acetyltransferase-like isoleucine patch superfamily enzyme